jgi:hypothetical protein
VKKTQTKKIKAVKVKTTIKAQKKQLKAIKKLIKKEIKKEKKKVKKSANKNHHKKPVKVSKKVNKAKEARRTLKSEDRSTADILRIRRKIWSNVMWVKKAAHGNEHFFSSEINESESANHKSINRAQQVLQNPSVRLPKARLAEIYDSMQVDYTKGLRALQEILISKARMRLDHQGLPRHPVDRMIHLAIRHGTHTGHLSAKHLKKIVKRMEKRVARIATKVTKKT